MVGIDDNIISPDTLRVAHYLLDCVVDRADVTLNRVDLTLHLVDLTLHLVDLTLHRVDLTLHRVDLTLHRVDLTLHRVDLTLHRVDSTLHRADLTLTGVDLTLNGVDLTLHRVDLTLTGLDLTLTGVDLTLNGADLTLNLVLLTLNCVKFNPDPPEPPLYLAARGEYIESVLVTSLNLGVPRSKQCLARQDQRLYRSNHIEPVEVPDYVAGVPLCKRRGGPDNFTVTPFSLRTRPTPRANPYLIVEEGRFVPVVVLTRGKDALAA